MKLSTQQIDSLNLSTIDLLVISSTLEQAAQEEWDNEFPLHRRYNLLKKVSHYFADQAAFNLTTEIRPQFLNKKCEE